MKSFQDKVLAELERIALAIDETLDVVQEAQYANTGRILVQRGFDTIVTLSYQFQSGGDNMLLINGAQHGPPGPDNYYVSATESARINQLFRRWAHLCGGGK